MENVIITREGVTREIPKSTWQTMVDEKATYGWQLKTKLPKDISTKEAQILKNAQTDKTKAPQEPKKDSQPKEVKPKGTKAKTDEK